MDRVIGARETSNVEHEQARAVIETFEHEMDALGVLNCPVFIRTEVVNSWGRKALNDSLGPEWKGQPRQLIRQLAARGHIPQIDRETTRIERQGKRERHSGMAWNLPEAAETIWLIYKDVDGSIGSRMV
jgi:hypothetical protein